MRILIVDDDRDSIEIMTVALKKKGESIKVLNALSGEECMFLLKTIHPSLIVMDLALPLMDGWETLACIRADTALAGIPVVAITNYHSPKVTRDAVRAGFDAYYAKPLNLSKFVNDLEYIVIMKSLEIVLPKSHIDELFGLPDAGEL